MLSRQRLRTTPSTLLACALLMLSGCANLAPDYSRPPAAVAAPLSAGQVLPTGQQLFTDARLQRLIELAMANNRDLRGAALKVEQARTQLSIQDAARLPGLSLGASASRSANDGRSASVQVGLTAFELDLFGHLRNASESALQSALASDESRRSVQLSLIAELANAWLTLAADLQREALIRQTLETRQRGQDLNQQRHQLGAIAGLALAQSQSALEQARLDLANATLQVEQDRHSIELLLGSALPAELAPTAGPLPQLAALPADLPSGLLLERPDVRAAEHQLQASHADIGAARAERFPRITLTGSAGSASRQLGDLFKAGTGVWSFGPSLSLPILDGGAGRAKVDGAEIARDIALAAYDKAVQTAFREVADALSVRASLAGRLATQTALADNAALQLRLAEGSWRAGGSSQLELLDAQRTLYAAQQALISLRLAEQGNRITLYKVLGGAWNKSNNIQ